METKPVYRGAVEKVSSARIEVTQNGVGPTFRSKHFTAVFARGWILIHGSRSKYPPCRSKNRATKVGKTAYWSGYSGFPAGSAFVKCNFQPEALFVKTSIKPCLRVLPATSPSVPTNSLV